MAAKKNNSTSALVTVIGALETLNDTDRQWVLQSAASKFALSVAAIGASNAQASAGSLGTPASLGTAGDQLGGAANADVQTAIGGKNPRAFIRVKKPATDAQRVACLGYYLVHTTGQYGFSSKDIRKVHTESGGSSINLNRALDNATRAARYLSNRGPREKQLTTLGEDVVNALPDQAAVKSAEQAAKGRRGGKRGARKKARKA